MAEPEVTDPVQPPSRLSMATDFVQEDADQLAPSKIQQLISEIFRISLCRNDDHNLAQSSIFKQLQTPTTGKKKGDSKDKLIGDLKSREDERQ